MRAASTLLVAVLLAGASCRQESPNAAPEEAATGNVVARVDGVEITREELNQGTRFAFHITRPDATERHLQRVALRDLLLPRAAIASLNREGRAQAHARAVALREELLDGSPAPVTLESDAIEVVESGDVRTFGPFVLGAALELEPGAWSDPIEGLGRYHLVRLVEPPVEGSVPSITLGVIDFVYEELTQAPEEVLAQTKLEIVDPALSEIIPAALRHTMRGEDSPRETKD